MYIIYVARLDKYHRELYDLECVCVLCSSILSFVRRENASAVSRIPNHAPYDQQSAAARLSSLFWIGEIARHIHSLCLLRWKIFEWQSYNFIFIMGKWMRGGKKQPVQAMEKRRKHTPHARKTHSSGQKKDSLPIRSFCDCEVSKSE